MRQESLIRDLLGKAGVTVNGPNPWDVQVHDDRLYARVLSQGSLGVGESYMDGWWDCSRLDELFCRALSARVDRHFKLNWLTMRAFLESRILNLQDRRRSGKVARQHYDLSSELYMSFLDPYNQYTCAYFKHSDTLDAAQQQKLALICGKLQLNKRDRVLDIGCGWGGFARYASERCGCAVTGITISREQAAYARRYTEGLPVTILESDYRDLQGQFDKVLICGMIEHVGPKNYRHLFGIVHKHLAADGLFLLHTIGTNGYAAGRRWINTAGTDAWMNKYIFPNGALPSVLQLARAAQGLFVLEDMHNFGADYDRTLLAWFDNFDRNWPRIKTHYDNRFYRMWRYYFLSCAGIFRARKTQLWQFVLSKHGIRGGYQSIR